MLAGLIVAAPALPVVGTASAHHCWPLYPPDIIPCPWDLVGPAPDRVATTAPGTNLGS